MRIALLALSVLGCLAPAKASVSVSDLASLFPTIERLTVHVYMLRAFGEEDDCEYFEYGRGAFASDPSDEFCRVFDFDERRPGGGFEGPVPVAFDQQAHDDLAALRAEFERVRIPIDYLNLVFDAAGAVGPDSTFSADGCVNYLYQPGWSALPEDIPGEDVSTGIDVDWYKTDSCP